MMDAEHPQIFASMDNRRGPPLRLSIKALLLLLPLFCGRLTHSTDLAQGFAMELLAANLNAVTALAPAPDGRIFIAEQTGRLLVWKDGGILPEPALALHVADFWERGLLGVALHPDFARTPQIYLLYVTDRPFVHHVLSQFALRGDKLDPASETILLEGDDQAKLGGFQPGGHQGGPLCFGPNGKLYVSLGEQTQNEAAQRLDTLQGKILRLNMDGSIPQDNPFHDKLSGKYRAIYGYGVRNSFGLAADSRTGKIFFTDVGGSAFEEVNELTAGANYGWPLAEGFTNTSSFKQPLHAYTPIVGRSIAGAAFCPKTNTFPAKWQGRFFFADYMNHWIKGMLPNDPTNIMTFARGLDGPVALAFAGDALLVLNRGAWVRDGKRFVPNAGTLCRIRFTGHSVAGSTEKAALDLPASYQALPKTLSATAIHNLVRRFPNLEGVQPVTLNCPPWEPGIETKRWVALLPHTRIKFSINGPWEMPSGAVFIWHFVEAGSGRRIETRLLVRGKEASYGASYRWRPNGSDADLLDEADTINLAGATKRLWFFPAPEVRMQSFSTSVSFQPELTTAQLNRLMPNPASPNPIIAWKRLGILDGTLSGSEIAALPRLAPPDESQSSLELRVRSYLAVNCAACHQPGGNSRGLFDARFETPLEQAGWIDGPLAAGDLGIHGAKVISPGDPERSMISHRLRRTDFFRMPPVQSHSEHSPIVPILNEWIAKLPAHQ